jgi:flagellar hook-basal body complex protein FliE
MTTTPSAAAAAYANLARLADPSAGAGASGSAATSGPSFGSLLQQAIGAVVEAGHKSDAQAQALASGKSNIVDVVTAVSETEVAVEALISVRDKVISAYEEIMRMPI